MRVSTSEGFHGSWRIQGPGPGKLNRPGHSYPAREEMGTRKMGLDDENPVAEGLYVLAQSMHSWPVYGRPTSSRSNSMAIRESSLDKWQDSPSLPHLAKVPRVRGQKRMKPPASNPQMMAFHAMVVNALDHIRSELAAIEDKVAPVADDSWTALAASAAEMTTKTLAVVDKIPTVSPEEARDLQIATADRLAKVEAEVARTEISVAPNADSLVNVATGHLLLLESSLHSMVRRILPREGAIRRLPLEASVPPAIQSRIGRIRARIAKIANEDREDIVIEARGALCVEIANLTQLVRRKWYEGEWGLQG